MPDNCVAVLTQAKQLLLEHGWIKDNFSNDKDQRCLVGAVQHAKAICDYIGGYTRLQYSHLLLEAYEAYNYLSQAVDELLRDESSATGSSSIGKLTRFNDCSSTTFNDVIAVLDRAVVLAKESIREEDPL
jgi:hypothetical protein